MPPTLASRRWLGWAGDLGLLLLGIAALIAATKYVDLMPTLGVANLQQARPMVWKEIITAIAPPVGWLLVIIGWRVVSRDQNARERRKEVRSEVENLIQQIHEVEFRLYDYLPTRVDSKESRSLQIRLKSDLQRLALALARLARFEEIDVNDALMALRQAVTGHDFDSSARRPMDLDSAWAHEVQTAANGLIEALQSAFRETHQ